MNESTAPPALGSDGANTHMPVSELNTAATLLVLEHGAMIMRDALEYSVNAEDADDAYQRSLEILLTKAPSTNPAELVPWLRTVVKNEALDITRRHARTSSDPIETIEDSAVSDQATPDEVFVRSETTTNGVEALERLSADQVHCLLAYAQGHSYDEISEMTGFTARKVTRCVTGGRRAFTSHFAAIESGSECERLEPVLQRMADGDSFAHVEARSHLRNCIGCRATLRAYREAPTRIAVLFPLPLVAAVAPPSVETMPGLFDHASAVWTGALERVNSQLVAVQQWFEAGTAKKLGAITATAAALTVGGVAANHAGVLNGEPVTPVAQTALRPVRTTPPRLFDPIDAPKRQPGKRHKKSKPAARAEQRVVPAPAAPPAPEPTRAAEPVGDGADEFLPENR